MKRISRKSIIKEITRALRGAGGAGVFRKGAAAAGVSSRKDLDRWRDLPSFRKESESGIEPPYEFNCTLVRSEINNFARIYQNNSVSEFMATVDDLFTEVAHIVSRYGGYIYEFTGAEAIYYFKDDEVGSSVAMALAALEDVNKAAARLSAELLKDRNYPLTLKSALAHDRLRFGKLVHSLCLAGPAFIETARILSAVSDSGGSVVVFDGRHREMAGDLMRVEPYAEIALRGYSGARELCIFGGRRRLHETLKLHSSESRAGLTLYRSDEALSEIVHWLHQPAVGDSFKTVIEVLAHLRQIPVTHSRGEPLAALIEWIDDLLRAEEGSSRERRQILASAVRVIENFACDFRPDVDTDELQRRLGDLLDRLSRHPDRRVTANALEAAAATDQMPASRINVLTGHIDNRVAANALVWSGKREITAFVIREMAKMIHSSQPARTASGLFALGEIAGHHRARDPDYYRSQVELQEMVAELALWLRHEDEAVQKQALAAARKINDPALNSVIRDIQEAAKAQANRPTG